MDLQLRDKVALVTGSSRGIGRGVALALAAEGTHVVLVARGEEALAAAADEVRGHGVEALTLVEDVTADGAAERLSGAVRKRFGRLDVLVSNVGGNRRKPFADTRDEDWDAILDLNFSSHVRLARAVLPLLPERPQAGAEEAPPRDGGVVLFVSSIFGREAGGPDLTIYNATKSALISLAKIMSLELAPRGIRVNSVAPGSILFPGGGWHRRRERDPEGIADFVRQNLPAGRFGTVQEVADVVAFLASPRSSWITGACVNVDGGQSRSLI